MCLIGSPSLILSVMKTPLSFFPKEAMETIISVITEKKVC